VELLDCKKVNLEKLRIAVFSDNRLYKPSEDVLQIFDKLRNNMTQAGFTLKEKLPEGITEALNIFDPYAIMGDGLKRILEKNNTSKVSLNWMLNLPDPKCSYLSTLVENVDEYRSKMSGFWNNYDVLICPVAADTAPAFENPMDQEVLFSYTTPFNITGWPSLVIRCGTASNGLPIGIQIVAPAWREDICFAVAKFLESNLGTWDNHFNFD
jgi:amidase